jgi:hypothetical protein
MVPRKGDDMTSDPPKPVSIGYQPVGQVSGFLIDESTGQPMQNAWATLGKLTEDAKVLYNFQAGRPDCSVDTDSTGAFMIEVPPGTYILTSPGGNPSDKIASASENLAPASNIPLLIIVVRGGQNVDLGKVQMSIPPGSRK